MVKKMKQQEVDEDYQARLRRKTEMRKSEAKKRSMLTNPILSLLTYKPFYIPCADSSPMYYKCKIVVYNLTFYNGSNGCGTCFVWTEMAGRMGACQIESILIQYWWSLGSEIEHVSFFCDNCAGQNCNQHVAALAYVVKMCHFKSEYKFSGSWSYTMECDSTHSAIECEKNNTYVFSQARNPLSPGVEKPEGPSALQPTTEIRCFFIG